jgi:hypothetical protein
VLIARPDGARNGFVTERSVAVTGGEFVFPEEAIQPP